MIGTETGTFLSVWFETHSKLLKRGIFHDLLSCVPTERVLSPWGLSEIVMQPAQYERRACCLLRALKDGILPVLGNKHDTSSFSGRHRFRKSSEAHHSLGIQWMTHWLRTAPLLGRAIDGHALIRTSTKGSDQEVEKTARIRREAPQRTDGTDKEAYRSHADQHVGCSW